MARNVHSGTPGRSDHYPPLRGRWAFLAPALIVGGGIAVLLLLAFVVGYRGPVAPGSVISQHANFEARCAECHTARARVPDVRCQRCHDPSGAGRLTNATHVLFGSGDLKKAGAAPQVDCARCHVDHRGRSTALRRVDEGHCTDCHFRSFSKHPEFAVVRNKSKEEPGILFTHDRHVVKEYVEKEKLSLKDSCLKCHEPSPKGRDLEKVNFERHCASCHGKGGSVGSMDPIPAAELLAPDVVAAKGSVNFKVDEFETSRGKLSRTTVHHKDDWVLANLRKMRRDLDPEGFAAERGALLARQGQLQRKLALSAPLAGLDVDTLKAREASLDSEIKGAEARIAAQSGAGDPTTGLARIDEVLAAAGPTGGPEADDLRKQLTDLRGAAAVPAMLPADDIEARRKELLTLLDAVEGADPGLKARAEDLRRRLLALSPGEAGVEMLTRVRNQRAAERARVRDELTLRQLGIAPPSSALLASDQRAIRDALIATQKMIADVGENPPGTPALSAEAKATRIESLGTLTAACQKCHVLDGAQLLSVRPAGGVMPRATFVHVPHLSQADCLKCHPGIEKSKLATDLHVLGVESCQECHRPRSVRQDCQSCHRYHPQAQP